MLFILFIRTPSQKASLSECQNSQQWDAAAAGRERVVASGRHCKHWPRVLRWSDAEPWVPVESRTLQYGVTSFKQFSAMRFLHLETRAITHNTDQALSPLKKHTVQSPGVVLPSHPLSLEKASSRLAHRYPSPGFSVTRHWGSSESCNSERFVLLF